MSKQQLLPYISNDDLFKHVKEVLDIAQAAVTDAESRLDRNVIDPFSALFDALRQNITLSQWLEQEKTRQIQKTMQNALGEFHPKIIGSIQGWEWLPVGMVIDVKSDSKKVIAEVKNKHNTTKGTDKKTLYDNLKAQLASNYNGYTGYYVEIVPSKKEPYNKPFTPSDNITHQRRPLDEKIRLIDGRSFYALASGHGDALKMLYNKLPIVIGDILDVSPEKATTDQVFSELFERAY